MHYTHACNCRITSLECCEDPVWIVSLVIHIISAPSIKVSSYIAQNPIIRITQSALHYTSLKDLFNQTPSQLLWDASNQIYVTINARRLFVQYPPLSIARYNFLQLNCSNVE